MYNLSLWISGLAAFWFTQPRIVVKKETIIQDRLDPRGLVATDIRFIRSKTPNLHWRSGMTLEEVAHQQGKVDMIRFIETNVIGRRLDGQPTTLRS